MAIQRRTHGAATAWSTSQPIPFSGSATLGDCCLLVALNTAAIGAAPAGWTEIATGDAGGYHAKVFRLNGDYPASAPAQPTVTATGGTGGVAWIEHYHSDTAGMTLDTAGQVLTDTDTTSTAFAAAGSSLTTEAGDLLLVALGVKTVSTMTAGPTAISITQAGAALGTQTGNFGARLAGASPTNSLHYGGYHRPVTTGATGAPSVTATAGTGGGNAAGVAPLIRLREVSADTADAGADQTVPAWDTVTLTGTGSAAGDWTQISGPTVTLDGTGGTRTFEAAPSNTPGDTTVRTFRYTVGTATDDMTVTTGSGSLFYGSAASPRAARHTMP